MNLFTKFRPQAKPILKPFFLAALIAFYIYGVAGIINTNLITEMRQSENPTRIELALNGVMKDKASATEKSTLISWARSGANQEDYNRRIRPIIKIKCLSCHNGSIPRAPNLNSYNNILKVAKSNKNKYSKQISSIIIENKYYFSSFLISSLILSYLIWGTVNIKYRFFNYYTIFATFTFFGLIFYSPNLNLVYLSIYLALILLTPIAILVFGLLKRPAALSVAAKSLAKLFFRSPALQRKRIGLLLIGSAALFGTASTAAYFGYKYVKAYGICLGVMCHYTGEISEYDKAYWQVESAAKRAALPKYKTLPALKQKQLSPSKLTTSENRFRTWEKVFGDPEGTKYSSLTGININNVQDLEVAWDYRADGDQFVTLQTNPIIVDGILFTPTANGAYVALNAKTGEEIWRFTPNAGAPAYRGVTWWKDPETQEQRLFFIAGDQLHSLDAKTGLLNKAFGNSGTLDTGRSHPAPVVTDDLVIIATFNAKIMAFDIRTGDEVWTFETRKREPELHRGGGEHYFVGANIWSGMAVDAERGLLYASIGNPRLPNYGALRPGDNLYSNSVVALDIQSGKLNWYFQETAHDLWDLDIASPPILTTIKRNNHRYDVVAVTTKAGNTLLLDRLSGGLIFDYRLRRTPTSTIAGEHTSAYQPDILLPQPFAAMEFSKSDITDLGKENTASVLKQLKGAKMGFYQPPVLNGKIALFGMNGGATWPGAASDPYEGILYIPSNRFPWLISLFYAPSDESDFPPSKTGAAYQEKCAECHGENREGIRNSKQYIPSLTGVTILNSEAQFFDKLYLSHPDARNQFDLDGKKTSSLYQHFSEYDQLIEKQRISGQKFLTSWLQLKDHQGYPGSKPPWGQLTAIDLNTGLIKWQVPFGNYQEIGDKRGAPTGQPSAGGAIVTAGGLVFATGTVDAKLRAFDKNNGAEVWSYQLPFSGSAPPSTYEIDGEQYLVVQATGRQSGYFKGLGNALIAFKIQR